MSDLKAVAGELRATVVVTRAATGKVETFELVGSVTEAQREAVFGKVHGASGSMVGSGAGVNQTKGHGDDGNA